MGLKKKFYLAVLGQEDPLGEGMATHSSTLAWRTPWMEKPWWAAVHGVAKSQTRTTEVTTDAWLCWVLVVACGIFSWGMRTLN